MSIESTSKSGITVIRLSGHLDASNAGAQEKELINAVEHSTTPVILDMAGVSYMSSEGLRLLIVTAKAANKAALPIIFASPSPMVMEILRLSMFTKVLHIEPTVDHAIEALG